MKRLVFEIDLKKENHDSKELYIIRCLEPRNYRSFVCLEKDEHVLNVAKIYGKSARYDELFPSCVISERAREKLGGIADKISKLFTDYSDQM
jgi:hypothetical protein